MCSKFVVGLRRCAYCRRRLPLRKFPAAAPQGRKKSRYCSGCWEYPVRAELKIRFLRHSIEVLLERWSQRSLFPDLVERVMVGELESYREQLHEQLRELEKVECGPKN